MLREGLDDLSDVFILPKAADSSDPSWFGFLLTVIENSGLTRDKIVKHLEDNNIQTRMLFAGNMIKHPCFDEMRKTGKGYRTVGALKNTDVIMNRTFWVGVYPGMTGEMLYFIIEKIKEIVGENR
jgi:CDP-6-deoxy-D-xylo-4-hexulose-3-dehydrase